MLLSWQREAFCFPKKNSQPYRKNKGRLWLSKKVDYVKQQTLAYFSHLKKLSSISHQRRIEFGYTKKVGIVIQ